MTQDIQTSESLVQLTDAMKRDDPDAKIKFLAEEELYGVGGPVFDANGNRVANELGKRDCVTGEMWENKPPFSLDLNNAVSDDRQCKHYTGRGVRKLHRSSYDSCHHSYSKFLNSERFLIREKCLKEITINFLNAITRLALCVALQRSIVKRISTSDQNIVIVFTITRSCTTSSKNIFIYLFIYL